MLDCSQTQQLTLEHFVLDTFEHGADLAPLVPAAVQVRVGMPVDYVLAQEKRGESGGTYQFCVQDSNDRNTENERGGDQNKQSSFHNNNLTDYWQMTAHFARAPPMTWLRNDNEPEARRIAMEMLQTRCRLFPGKKADITTRFRNPPTLTCPVALS